MTNGVEAVMIKARSAEKRGDLPEAQRLYQSVLERFPKNARARQGLDQIIANRTAAGMMADSPPEPTIERLADIYRRGMMPQVVAEAETLLAQYPRSAFVHNILSAAWLSLGEPAQAEAALRRALAADVRQPALYSNLGMALASLGRHEEAVEAYQGAITLEPRYATARNNIGNSLKAIGRKLEALESYRAAVETEPNYPDAWNNLGLLLADLGRGEEAEEAYAQVLRQKPDHAAAHNNLGNLLNDRGDLTGATTLYEKALEIDPDYADAHYNLGNILKRQGRVAEATAAYERAQAAGPDRADAWIEHGKALALEARYDEAIAALGKALEIDPSDAGARMHRLFYQAYVCDWTELDSFDPQSPDIAVSPWPWLSFEDDPARQLRRSRAWTRHTVKQQPLGLPNPEPAANGKIRIGYFSADFHDHATMYLMAGLLRTHDRDRFEIHAFSFGKHEGDAMRGAVLDHVDSFTDIRAMPDAEVARLANAKGLDIAVDLKGYTNGTRSQLFACRMAPVQIAYLGYPGSMGADFIDYMVSDAVVVPEHARIHYDEKQLLLPHSYQCNDDRRDVSGTITTRADFGLPDDAFVFACFNQSYKIGPREFAIWMRLLGQVAGSVLWLIPTDPSAVANLRREAAAYGIAPERLVFSAVLPNDQHLARHVHADLFLDTFAVNAHTTASDALFVGLPVATLVGKQFAARVGASLLGAIGVPELVAETETEYEALCLDLATAPGKLAAIRAKLAANRRTQPLFDTARHTRALEAAYAAALERHRAGLAPDHITISE
jgi:predicted O-linked N-acetylglucosamine transferase (SPINDLY family)